MEGPYPINVTPTNWKWHMKKSHQVQIKGAISHLVAAAQTLYYLIGVWIGGKNNALKNKMKWTEPESNGEGCRSGDSVELCAAADRSAFGPCEDSTFEGRSMRKAGPVDSEREYLH